MPRRDERYARPSAWPPAAQRRWRLGPPRRNRRWPIACSTNLEVPHLGAVESVVEVVGRLGLLSATEQHQIFDLLDPSFAFALAMGSAASIHAHIKLFDPNSVHHDALLDAGAIPSICMDGYVKYRFPGGVEVVFSSIPVAVEDLAPRRALGGRPFLDHLGVELNLSHRAKAAFDAVPSLAAAEGWRHLAQGHSHSHNVSPVKLGGKHWVFPGEVPTGTSRPVEFALRPLLAPEWNPDFEPLRPVDPLLAAFAGNA